MKFATYYHGNSLTLGVLSADGGSVYPLDALGLRYSTMLELVARYSPQDEDLLKARLALPACPGTPIGEIHFAAPIPYPRHDLICVGTNYAAHAMESARFKGKEYVKPPHPLYFSKRVVQPVGHEEDIPSHRDITQSLDYECELAVVIGKTCSHTAPEDVFRHIFGYTIVNDISARDIQNRHVQYLFGKSLDGSAPMGPYIVTADELDAPPHLAIRTRVNGELRQDSNTSDFIFDIPYLVSQLSSGITLEPGDIIITGTPAGVGLGFHPPKFLEPGDVVECEIQGIGILRNTVK